MIARRKPIQLDRRCAEIIEAETFTIGDFYAALDYNRRDQPKTIDLRVNSWLFERTIPAEVDASAKTPDEIIIHLAVMGVRQIWSVVEDDNPCAEEVRASNWYKKPEFEIEGYLVDPPNIAGPERIWVRLAFRSRYPTSLNKVGIYLLEPGEEHGTDWTPGIN